MPPLNNKVSMSFIIQAVIASLLTAAIVGVAKVQFDVVSSMKTFVSKDDYQHDILGYSNRLAIVESKLDTMQKTLEEQNTLLREWTRWGAK